MNIENHDMDNLFKQAFENHEVPPPSNFWNRIEDDLPVSEQEVDAAFRKAFLNHEVEPTPHVWDNIRRRLPISLVLRNHLNQLSRVAAVLLVGMFVIFTWENWENTTYTPLVNTTDYNTTEKQVTDASTQLPTQTTENQTSSSDVAVTNTQTTTNELVTTPTQSSTVNTVQWNTNEFATDTRTTDYPTMNVTPIPFRSEKVKTDLFAGKEETIENLKADNNMEQMMKLNTSHPNVQPLAMLPVEELKNVLVSNYRNQTPTINPLAKAFKGSENVKDNTPSIQSNNEEKEIMDFKGFYMAAGAQVNNTRIVNQTLQQAVSLENAEADHAASFGNMYSLSLGYKLNNKIALEGGVAFNEFNQNYREITTAHGKVTTDANLNYLQIPLMVKINKNSKSNRKVTTFNYVAGLQYGRLIGNPTVLNDAQDATNPTIAKTEFVNNELGVFGGIDYDIFLNSQVSATFGGRIGVGTDLFASNNSTYHTLLGAKIGLNYRFK